MAVLRLFLDCVLIPARGHRAASQASNISWPNRASNSCFFTLQSERKRLMPERIEHMLVDLTAVVTRIGLISSFAGATKWAGVHGTNRYGVRYPGRSARISINVPNVCRPGPDFHFFTEFN